MLLIPAPVRQKQAVSSKTARAPQRNPVSKQNKTTKTRGYWRHGSAVQCVYCFCRGSEICSYPPSLAAYNHLEPAVEDRMPSPFLAFAGICSHAGTVELSLVVGEMKGPHILHSSPFRDQACLQKESPSPRN